MALNPVSSQAVQQVQLRLSNPDTGLNSGIAANAPNYGLPVFMSINFAQPSYNFFLAQIDADTMEDSGIFRYPFICLYGLESQNTNDQKFTQFSGLVRIVMDVYLSWPQTRPTNNMDSYAHCVEDVVYDIINRRENQNWGSYVSYNGNIHFRRAPVRFAAESFRQQIACAITFGVNQ